MSPTIDLLRHGDTGQQSYRGQLDDSLSELGWTQLREAVQGLEWDCVVASSLQRCAAFGREIAERRGVPLRLEPRLIEYYFGEWQAVTIEALAENQPDALGNFWMDPVSCPPPGAEPFEAFHARVSAAMDDIVAQHPGKRVLVVTHGAVIRLLRCFTEQRSYGEMANTDVPHASLHRLPWSVSIA